MREKLDTDEVLSILPMSDVDVAGAPDIEYDPKPVSPLLKERQWFLGISEEEFDEIYTDTSKVDKSLFQRLPKDTNDLYENFLPSKLWRLNNLYTVIDKTGNKIPFTMKRSQHIVYAASLIHTRLIILKSRQQGISTFFLIYFFDDVMMLPNLSVGLMAQGEDEATLLLDKVKLAWDTFPSELKQHLNLTLVKDNSKAVKWSNDSQVFIRTSFRSATLQRLHISEYGKICRKYPEKAKETNTGTLQTIQVGNLVVIESTAEGDNDFKKKWYKAKQLEAKIQGSGSRWPGKSFKPVFLSWLEDDDCLSDVYEVEDQKQTEYFAKMEKELNRLITTKQRNYWIDQFNELGDDIYQEYPSTPEEAFLKVNRGTYYASQFAKVVIQKNHIVPNLYDSNLKVHVAMDLGRSEQNIMVLLYFQRYKNEWRIIQEYTNHSEELKHYVEHMRSTGYNIDWVICPHDIRVTDLTATQSRKDLLYSYGVAKILELDQSDKITGMEIVRKHMKNMWFDEKCEYLRECMLQYGRDWDERLQTWYTSATKGRYAHGADAIRYMAVSEIDTDYELEDPLDPLSKDPEYSVNDTEDGMSF